MVTNASPITADLATFAILHFSVIISTQLTLHRLGRGRYNLMANALFDYLRIPVTITAMAQLISGDRLSFQVPNKGGTGTLDDRKNPPPPASLVLVLVASQAAWLFYLLKGLGLVPGEIEPQALVSALALLANSLVVAVALGRIRKGDFGDERRRARRFTRTMPIAVNGERFNLSRPSTSGGFIEGQPRLGKQVIHVATREGAIPIECWVAHHDESGATVEFTPGQWASRAHISRSMFSSYIQIAHLPIRPDDQPKPNHRADDSVAKTATPKPDRSTPNYDNQR